MGYDSRCTSTAAAVLVAALMIAPPMVLMLAGEADGQRSGETPWWNTHWTYRYGFNVGPSDFELRNYPIELELDLQGLARKASGTKDAANPASLRLIEYTGEGSDAGIVPQQDGSYFVPLRWESGMLTFIIDGTVSVGQKKYYQLYFDTGPDYDKVPYNTKAIDGLDWISRGQLFYGFNPGVESYYKDNFTEGLHIVGLCDSTKYTVYDITAGRHDVLASGTVQAGGLATSIIPDGTFFGLETDKPVAASLDDALNVSAKTFYPSMDGGLAGTEFKFMAYKTDSYGTVIHAVDGDSIVKFTDSKGNTKEASLRAGQRLAVDLAPGEVYTARSTYGGTRIMLESCAINAFSAIPTENGLPVGRRFDVTLQPWAWEKPTWSAFTVLGYDTTTVRVRNSDTNIVLWKEQVDPKQSWYKSIPSDSGIVNLTFESDGDISVIAGGNELSPEMEGAGDDITFAGGQRARKFVVHAYSNPPPPPPDTQYPAGSPSGIVFSLWDGNNVEVDGKPLVLSKGGYITLGSGPHRINAGKPSTVMILGRGMDGSERHRWNDWGTYLAGRLLNPPIQGADSADHYEDRYGMELLPGPGEMEAAARLILHRGLPGVPSTFTVRVHNTGNREDTYNLAASWVLPPGWIIGLSGGQPNTITLSANETYDDLVTLTPPAEAKADDWAEVNLTASSNGNASVKDHMVVRLVVNATYYVRLRCNELVRHVDPGTSAVFTMELRNEGNAPDNLLLAATRESGENWAAVISNSTVSLASGASKAVNLTVQCPSNALANRETSVRVMAMSLGNSTMTGTVLTRTIANLTRGFESAFDPLERSVRPGQSCRFNGSLHNSGNALESFGLGFAGMPADWTVRLSSSYMALGTQGNESISVDVIPGMNALPGKYPVRISVSDSVGNTKETELTVRILQVYCITLSAGEVALTGKAGSSLRFPLTVGNQGNGADTVEMLLLGTDNVGVFEPRTASLGAKSSSSASLNLTVPSFARPGTYKFNVTARSLGDPTVTASAQLSFRILVPKDTTSAGDLWCIIITLVVVACFGGYMAVYERERRLRLRLRSEPVPVRRSAPSPRRQG
jgi:uncharacterized membrane protein